MERIKEYSDMTEGELREELAWLQGEARACAGSDGMEAGKYLHQANKVKDELKKREA